MTLHESIITVLQEKNRPMNASDIAHEINTRKLYQQRKGTPVPSSQISARVNKVNERAHQNGIIEPFYKQDGLIGLNKWQYDSDVDVVTASSVDSVAKNFRYSDELNFEGDVRLSSFLPKNGFQSIGVIRDLIRGGLPSKPDLANCGLYTITTPEGYKVDFIDPSKAEKDGNVISPWPVARLESKWVPEVSTVYIGAAGVKSHRPLRRRLLDLLRHCKGKTSDRGPHKGGEITWQLVGYGNFSIWILSTEGPPIPRNLELKLLMEFERQTGRLPFANRQK